MPTPIADFLVVIIEHGLWALLHERSQLLAESEVLDDQVAAVPNGREEGADERREQVQHHQRIARAAWAGSSVIS